MLFRSLAVVVELLSQQAGGRVVVPAGHIEGWVLERIDSSRGQGGITSRRHSNHSAFGIVLVPYRVCRAVLANDVATEIVDGVSGLIEGIDDFDLTAILVVNVGGTVRRGVFRVSDLTHGVVGRGGGVAASVGGAYAAVESVVGVTVRDGGGGDLFHQQPVTLDLDLRLDGSGDGGALNGLSRAGIDGLRRGGDVAADVLGFRHRDKCAKVCELLT